VNKESTWGQHAPRPTRERVADARFFAAPSTMDDPTTL
jgi:hypothetical protein